VPLYFAGIEPAKKIGKRYASYERRKISVTSVSVVSVCRQADGDVFFESLNPIVEQCFRKARYLRIGVERKHRHDGRILPSAGV
jgi:hypothetical protein